MTGTSSRYDLRSNAVDSKRDRETKQKWGPNALKGERILHQDLHTVSNKQRPANSRDRALNRPMVYSPHCPRERTRYARARSQHKKANPLADPSDDPRQEVSSLPEERADFSSTDDSTPEAEDHNVMYSFDAPTGPTQGEDVLAKAVNQAVVRFEDGQTVKLVVDEYDVVADGYDEPGGIRVGGETVDEDFEIV